jgi:hypothetical protein
MKMAKLLQKASQVLATAAVAGCLGTPVLANAQYAVGDSQLSAAVGKAITGDAKLQSLNISATVAQGIVTLTGTVPNEADRVEAEQVAAGVDGVRSIQDNLALPAGASDQPPAAANANGADVNQPRIIRLLIIKHRTARCPLLHLPSRERLPVACLQRRLQIQVSRPITVRRRGDTTSRHRLQDRDMQRTIPTREELREARTISRVDGASVGMRMFRRTTTPWP